jgi:hypothetical protein
LGFVAVVVGNAAVAVAGVVEDEEEGDDGVFCNRGSLASLGVVVALLFRFESEGAAEVDADIEADEALALADVLDDAAAAAAAAATFSFASFWSLC